MNNIHSVNLIVRKKTLINLTCIYVNLCLLYYLLNHSCPNEQQNSDWLGRMCAINSLIEQQASIFNIYEMKHLTSSLYHLFDLIDHSKNSLANCDLHTNYTDMMKF